MYTNFMNDKKFMEIALKQARLAFEKGEVPVGAVVVYDNKIISMTCNGVEEQKDATCHAELMAIRRAALFLKRWRLTGCTLYTTLEPCVMCAGAIILSRIDRLVYGAKDLRHGGDGSLISLMREKHPIHNVEITSGVYEDESASLMREFFYERRKEKDLRRIDSISGEKVDEDCGKDSP
ncbi:MAG: tRNA adenosine(34) deaminase TadA [Chlamydiales bacterium]